MFSHLCFALCDLNESWNLLFEHDKESVLYIIHFVPFLHSSLWFQASLFSPYLTENPAPNSDYYLQFKDLIRMTDVSHCSLNAL